MTDWEWAQPARPAQLHLMHSTLLQHKSASSSPNLTSHELQTSSRPAPSLGDMARNFSVVGQKKVFL
jgi:hypothetical protein